MELNWVHRFEELTLPDPRVNSYKGPHELRWFCTATLSPHRDDDVTQFRDDDEFDRLRDIARPRIDPAYHEDGLNAIDVVMDLRCGLRIRMIWRQYEQERGARWSLSAVGDAVGAAYADEGGLVADTRHGLSQPVGIHLPRHLPLPSPVRVSICQHETVYILLAMEWEHLVTSSLSTVVRVDPPPASGLISYLLTRSTRNLFRKLITWVDWEADEGEGVVAGAAAGAGAGAGGEVA